MTSDGGLANPKATESNVLLPRALCRDDDTPSMDGLASDVMSSWLRYSFEDLFSKATMYKFAIATPAEMPVGMPVVEAYN